MKLTPLRLLACRRFSKVSSHLPMACVLVLGITSPAIAVDRTWLGTTNSDWGNSTNWSPSGTMSSGDTAVFDGTASGGRSPDQNTGVSFEKILFKGTAGQAYTPGFGSWTVAGSSTTTFIEVESGNNYHNHVNPDRGSGPLITLKSGNNTILNNGSGSLTVSSGSTWTGNVIRANGSGNSTLIVDGSGTTYLATASNLHFNIADNGARVLSLTKNGVGALYLETANTFSGVTTVNTGVLRVANGNALGATGSAARTEISGNETTGRLELSGGITTGETFQIGMRQLSALDAPALSNFSGNNTVTGNINGVTGGSRINIESQAGLLTLAGNLSQTSGTGSRTWQLMGAGNGLVSGVISNGTATNLGIRKTGTGTWTMSNDNTYTGTTSVIQGTLVIDGDNTAATGNLSVASAATLGGSGTIGGAVNVTGILAPGNSIDTLTVSNDVTWTGAAAASAATDWQFELGLGTADLLDITGGSSDFLMNTALGSIFRFDFLDTGEFNDTYTLVSWDGITDFDALDFSYINLASGKTGSFAIVGSSLEFTVVPEPGAFMLSLAGTSLLLRRRRILR